ncbi:MAG TPA: acetyl-CoA C-acyltransferase family protein [Accumulibacter sp.]|uniref:Acetyl-CoA C-acyltransferase family protein n=2 Tax=Candidatus Accumulibacter TaxID=327159 RepID=A0A080M128_9PROT|nr:MULTISPECIES: acetyl-CoA C-acyltransferase family protein [Candidatus Accumulibacter]KFB74943.1 MAG: Beta-ketothiolase BktB [Candidatus Accumulibacter cognatus]MBL8402041.1 acetyl-CoA C-acyltransferase family protein [Accumulibacter sp.]MBN8519340.1 acetyl-CoA C-acyltransferase family protein [Accumulibacter sp.]MBO3711083.1 acetyl-CoA C-acyltransferase family protein [Accumulibacter sp.]MCC2866883.1 acetyl-CoA C-acyltransferase family protein [Candidatus Accumulibacter phosphatis]
MSREVVVLSAVRSAIGTFGGSLANMEPHELAGTVMKESIARSGVDPQQITYVTVGNCIPTDSRFAYVARVASIQAGLSMDSVAMAVNRLCASGLQGIVTTAQNIMLGDADYGIGGGVEVMSRGSYMLTAMRSGARMGDTKAIDMMVATLNDPFGAGHMGVTAENLATKWQISREEQDALSAESHRRAAAAIADGRFKSQIVPIVLKTRKGDVVFDTDEHVKPATTIETLAKMKPAFTKDGTVTAGNASGINDGAAFMVLTAADVAARAGQKPIARLVAYAVAGVPNEIMGEGPIPATKAVLKKAGLTLDQMDVIESNEAFAAQAIAVSKGLGLDPVKTNPNGGAIALGHPVGCSGAFIATKAIYELQRVGGKYALVTMCIGGGQGIAVIFERT